MDPFEQAQQIRRAAQRAEERIPRPEIAIVSESSESGVSVAIPGRDQGMGAIPSMTSSRWLAPNSSVLIMPGVSPSLIGGVPWAQGEHA